MQRRGGEGSASQLHQGSGERELTSHTDTVIGEGGSSHIGAVDISRSYINKDRGQVKFTFIFQKSIYFLVL